MTTHAEKTPMVRTLGQVTAGHFCAGVVLHDGVCIEAAPILKWAVGWTSRAIAAYARRKGWKWREWREGEIP